MKLTQLLNHPGNMGLMKFGLLEGGYRTLLLFLLAICSNFKDGHMLLGVEKNEKKG